LSTGTLIKAKGSMETGVWKMERIKENA
jgi:hypothetical protein